jgi:hypothetical protein
MPAPQHNNKKTLNHRDTHYRWIVWNKRTFNELTVEMSASVNGQLLLAELPRVVNHQMVPDAIDFARKNGWKPEAAGPPFRCKYTRKGFVISRENAEPPPA